ncbi:MAG: hypothetical protein KAR20_05410 [Candidatus Heimdallarchaeota archaeon]|nr:hypothetical protein [Candidatus Heimdallarchaeota archaeon]
MVKNHWRKIVFLLIITAVLTYTATNTALFKGDVTSISDDGTTVVDDTVGTTEVEVDTEPIVDEEADAEEAGVEFVVIKEIYDGTAVADEGTADTDVSVVGDGTAVVDDTVGTTEIGVDAEPVVEEEADAEEADAEFIVIREIYDGAAVAEEEAGTEVVDADPVVIQTADVEITVADETDNGTALAVDSADGIIGGIVNVTTDVVSDGTGSEETGFLRVEKVEIVEIDQDSITYEISVSPIVDLEVEVLEGGDGVIVEERESTDEHSVFRAYVPNIVTEVKFEINGDDRIFTMILPALDKNLDGVVDLFDFSWFVEKFLGILSLPEALSGFVITATDFMTQ